MSSIPRAEPSARERGCSRRASGAPSVDDSGLGSHPPCWVDEPPLFVVTP